MKPADLERFSTEWHRAAMLFWVAALISMPQILQPNPWIRGFFAVLTMVFLACAEVSDYAGMRRHLLAQAITENKEAVRLAARRKEHQEAYEHHMRNMKNLKRMFMV